MGDELASINGKKEFINTPPSSILAGLQPPVSLVFLGFIGKVHAEVRMRPGPEMVCGMPLQTHVVSGASVEFCEVVVFQQPTASLLLATSSQEQRGQEVLYELQRDEARDIVQLALVDDGLLLV